MEEKNYLYDWVFHFNPYTKQWAAVPRETYSEYWNDANHPNVIRSKKFETLLDILYKSNGNVEEFIEKIPSE